MWSDFFYDMQTMIFVVDPTEKRKAKYMKLLECVITNESNRVTSDTE